MKFRLMTAIFSTLVSLSAFAVGGDMGGGRAHMVLPTSEVEAFISKDGTYTTILDLQDGIEKLNGVRLTPVNTILDISNPARNNIESIILRNGAELQLNRIQAASGGDMGGG